MKHHFGCLYRPVAIFVQQSLLLDLPQLTQLQTDLDVVLPIQYCLGIDPYTYAVN